MLLSRFIPGRKKNSEGSTKKSDYKLAELDEFLLKKDYTGAISLLKYKESKEESENTSLWLGHCYFRAGEYRQAVETYQKMLKKYPHNTDVHVYIACCLLYLGEYTKAKTSAEKGPKSALQNRLLFHLSHKLNDEKKLMSHHLQLGNSVEDQLCLASIHYMRQHYGEAIEIYKEILKSQPTLIALNYYLAMCYFKQDYPEVADDVLKVYLRSFPDSPAAQNLRLCIRFKGFGLNADVEAENLLKSGVYPSVKQLLRHNLVCFRLGDGALQVLPTLVDTIPEARINLILYHLKKQNYKAAAEEAEHLEPVYSIEFIMKAVAFTLFAETLLPPDGDEYLREAEAYFIKVGESAMEKDTVPGRECLASGAFLGEKYADAVDYLETIKEQHQHDDWFFLNIAQALIMCGKYTQAEVELLKVSGQDRDKILFKSFLTKTFIRNGKPHYAWDVASKTQESKERVTLLKIIANDCYVCGSFFYSAKAFDQLEKIDPSIENWNGKRGATSGLFQQLMQGTASPEQMSEVLRLVDQSNQSQAEYVSSTIRKWATKREMNLNF